MQLFCRSNCEDPSTEPREGVTLRQVPGAAQRKTPSVLGVRDGSEHRSNAEIAQRNPFTPILVLHGLLGSSQNWNSFLTSLSGRAVYALDLRNHGQSPWTETMNFPLMVEDVLESLQAKGLSRVHLIGHSLGGKVAMQLACRFPQKVSSLTVVDIAPKFYPPHHKKLFDALMGLPLADLKSRAQADSHLSKSIEDPALRAFLLTNLGRDANGTFFLRPNLTALSGPKNIEEISQNPLVKGDSFEGPCWWLKGAASHYIRTQDLAVIKEHFPAVFFETWEGIGHNPHTEAPTRFQEAFLQKLD